MKEQHEVEQFLYRQADMLDSQQWQAWIDLFDKDGVYWMPPEPSHKTWEGMPAIFAEDKNLMKVRMGRVLHPDAWSQRPLWGTNHIVSNVSIQKVSGNGDIEKNGSVESGPKMGTSEAPMRNQMKAWAKYMKEGTRTT